MNNGPDHPELEWTGERYVPQVEGNIRLEHLHRYLLARSQCRGRRVLDIACGEGYGASLLAQVAKQVYAIDIAGEAVSHVRRAYPRSNLAVCVGVCAAIPLADDSIDVVVSFETLEHLSEHEEMMREVRRVLVPGGTLIISTPDRREYSDVPGYANPFHVRELYRPEFEALLRSSFRHVAVVGQRLKAGSLIWPIEDLSACSFEGFAAAEKVDTVEPLGPPMYLIGLASDQPVSQVPVGLLDGGEFALYADYSRAFIDAERHSNERLNVEATARAAAEARAAEAGQNESAAMARATAAEQARETAEQARGIAERARETAELLAASADRERLAAASRAQDEHDRLRTDLQFVEVERRRLEDQVRTMERSRSWRYTAAFRGLRRSLASPTRSPRSTLRALYASLPLSIPTRLRIRTTLFRRLPFLFRSTASYRAWELYSRTQPVLQRPASDDGAASRAVGEMPSWFYREEIDEYVGLSRTSPVHTRIKAIAFYLPQFHPIPENDRWWGKGFTEWVNVSRAKPQFAGHYQPHLPGELGFYDLRLVDVQRRQIELAKNHGVHGFCYYHYWFAGRRLLHQPLDQFLANPDLNFPFCLCWANENWTRRWDGNESEVLIAQHYSPEDDLAFIRDIEPVLRDPRYIRVDDRPLLIVYRPALLPDARATAERWRAYCREAGIGDLYLVCTQAFDRTEPAAFGFDAAMEFAPNNLGPLPITDRMPIVNPGFRGVVYDYKYLVDYSRALVPSPYTLFRSVTPMWDNEARRPGRGTIFANASPALYREALENTCRYTDALLGPDTPFVFINAWNEWAEGAHLEPDRRHGYAYLQATADALAQFPTSAHRQPIVLVSHDAYFHGAQHVAVTLARTLSVQLGYAVEIILCGDGPLKVEFQKYGRVHDFYSPDATPEHRERLVRLLFENGARLALCNTAVVGSTVEQLHHAGFVVVSMIHELPGVIKERGLEASIAAIAACADRIVFPASVVRERFVEETRINPTRTWVRPQGLLAPNRFRDRRDQARRELRDRLRLSMDQTVVLGMGFAERRKGLDLFVEAGLQLSRTIPELTMLWVGYGDDETLASAQARIAETGSERLFLFPGQQDDPDVFFAGADIYLMTSREDPFPLVVLHALDAEIPVVGFEGAGGFVELLRRGCGALVPYLDAAAMASAAAHLLADATTREGLTATGRRIIDDEFDFASYTRFLVELGAPLSPTVSVIVPNYNYARYLPARLRSIMAQTLRPHEIIVLDDCSSDDSLAVAERVLQDCPIPYRIIPNATNQGCYRQWMNGLREASGDLVWIAEADDDCAPTLLATLVQAFDRPAVALAYCQSRQIDGDGRELAPDYLAWTADVSATKWRSGYVRSGLDEITDTLIIKNTIPNVSAVLFRKPDLSAIEATLVTMRNAGDWLVYVHVLEQGDVAFFPASLNDHRRHAGGLTIGKGGLNLMKEILQVQQYIRDRHPITADVDQKRLAHLQTTYEYLRLDADGPASYLEHDALRESVTAKVDS